MSGAYKGGAAKNIVISAAAETWGRENGHAELMDNLRRFIALYQASWKLRQLERQTNATVAAAQKRIDDATHTLEAQRSKLYTEALDALNGIRLTNEVSDATLPTRGGS